MHFQVKPPENGRQLIFREKQTRNTVPLMFLDAKRFIETEHLRFWTLTTNKEGTKYVFCV